MKEGGVKKREEKKRSKVKIIKKKRFESFSSNSDQVEMMEKWQETVDGEIYCVQRIIL